MYTLKDKELRCPSSIYTQKKCNGELVILWNDYLTVQGEKVYKMTYLKCQSCGITMRLSPELVYCNEEGKVMIQ